MRMLTVLLPILLTAVASIFLLLRLPPTMRTTAFLLVVLSAVGSIFLFPRFHPPATPQPSSSFPGPTIEKLESRRNLVRYEGPGRRHLRCRRPGLPRMLVNKR